MKILIVDDNPDILESLFRGLAWEELGFEPPYLAEHAAAAKRILRAEQVDILMTDIEMPGENGLELFAWVREYDSGIPCIFLTSHASFSYCQQAIRNGGYDYILQPARLADIESVVRRCRAELLAARRDQAMLELGREQSCYSLFAKGKLFAGQMDEWMAGNDPRQELAGYQPAVFALPDGADAEKAKDFYECLLRLLEDSCGEGHYIAAELSPGVSGVVLFRYAGDGEEKGSHILTEVWAAYRDLRGEELTLYIGNCAKRDLPYAVGRIMAQRKDNVYGKSGIFYAAKEPERIQIAPPDPAKWERWICSGDGVLVSNQIRNLIRNADTEGMLSLDYMRLLSQSYMDALRGACHEAEIPYQELFHEHCGMRQFEEAFRHVTTFEESVAVTLQSFEQKRKATDEIQAMSMEERIHMVAEYIENHLSEPLSRADMAGKVFLSEDYFARIFKSVTGCGFKEYVMRHKMEHAKMLLSETAFPVSVIASKVGYDNFSNFAQAFKKLYGMPPKEYRRNGADGEAER